jgi:integrase
MRRAGCRRCAFIIAVLAYAGLRPQELLALEWDDVLTDVAKLFIARKNVDGQVLSYLKSGRRHRNRRHRRVDLFGRSPPTCACTACVAPCAGAW